MMNFLCRFLSKTVFFCFVFSGIGLEAGEPKKLEIEQKAKKNDSSSWIKTAAPVAGCLATGVCALVCLRKAQKLEMDLDDARAALREEQQASARFGKLVTWCNDKGIDLDGFEGTVIKCPGCLEFSGNGIKFCADGHEHCAKCIVKWLAHTNETGGCTVCRKPLLLSSQGKKKVLEFLDEHTIANKTANRIRRFINGL